MTVQQHKQSPQKNQSTGRGRQPGVRQSASPQAAPDLQRALEDPAQASPAEMLQLQRAAGNRAVSGLIQVSLIQARLRVGPVGDAYEQQADRMADQVMRSPAPAIQRQGAPEEEELQAKRRGGGGFAVDEQTRQEIASQQGHGAPLPDDLQAKMEAHFGADFSAVRVHADSQAANLNQRLRAQAFTHQADIYFDSGLYKPGASSGKRLLAHELTHVIQQGAAGQQRKNAPPGPAVGSRSLPSAHSSIQRLVPPQRPLPRPPTRRPAPTSTTVEEEDEGLLDKMTGALGSSAVGTGSSMYENIINWTTQNPHKMGPDEWSQKTPQEIAYTRGGGGAGAGLSGVKSLLDFGAVYAGARDLYKSHKTRSDPQVNPLKKEMAWKKEKSGAKTLGAGLLAGTGDVLSTISGGITATGQTASALSSAAGGFGVGVSAIDLGRNLWGMGRSAHKARQLGGWLGRGGLMGEIGQKEKSLSGGKSNLELAASGNQSALKKVREMQSLGDIAKYAHKHKARTAGLKALGAVGAGLGVAGGIAALASNPVGWALAGVGAGVGLGIGAYMLGRGLWKRSHRRDKLTEAEEQLGITRPKEGRLARFGKWITGKDIDERREAIKKHVGSGYRSPIVERALKTEKQRKAEKLTEHLTSSQTSTEGKGFAGRIGSILGVTTDEGKVKQSRGWKFWKPKDDSEVKDVNTKEKKEEMAELFARKLGSS